MIIDFHTHFFPDKIAHSALTILAGRSGLSPHTEGTADSLRSSMAQAGISQSVLLSVATNPAQTAKVNDFAVSVGGNGIIPFGSVHPEYEDWCAELERLKRSGIRGIKLHPDYQGMYIDSDRSLEIIEYASSLGFVISVHSGRDIGIKGNIRCTPQRAARMLSLVPSARVVLAHMGGWDMWEDVAEYLVGRDVYLDTSFCIPYMEEGAFLALVRSHGAERIVFGSDSPWGGQKEDVERIEKMPLTTGEKELIFYKNAERLLGEKFG